MLHSAHQQVTKLVCLLLGAGLGVSKSLIRALPLSTAACCWKQLMRALMQTDQNIIERELTDTVKYSVELRGSAE